MWNLSCKLIAKMASDMVMRALEGQIKTASANVQSLLSSIDAVKALSESATTTETVTLGDDMIAARTVHAYSLPPIPTYANMQ